MAAHRSRPGQLRVAKLVASAAGGGVVAVAVDDHRVKPEGIPATIASCGRARRRSAADRRDRRWRGRHMRAHELGLFQHPAAAWFTRWRETPREVARSLLRDLHVGAPGRDRGGLKRLASDRATRASGSSRRSCSTTEMNWPSALVQLHQQEAVTNAMSVSSSHVEGRARHERHAAWRAAFRRRTCASCPEQRPLAEPAAARDAGEGRGLVLPGMTLVVLTSPSTIPIQCSTGSPLRQTGVARRQSRAPASSAARRVRSARG